MYRLLSLFFLLSGVSAAARDATCEPIDPVRSSEHAAVYLNADSMPTVGGRDVLGFRDWVAGKLDFNDLLFAEDRTLRMVVSMIVEPDGTLSEVTLMYCPDERVKAEIERVIAMSPRWTPGAAEGRAVRVRCMFPLTLHFEKNTASEYDFAQPETDTMPVFDCDGTRSFPEWLWNRIPRELTPDSLRTLVRVACIVECDGSLSDLMVCVSGKEEELLSEAVVAALADVPRCAPGMSKGVPVRMEVLLKAIWGVTTPHEKQGVCVIVKQMPRFQGGDLNTFHRWVVSNVNYPAKCREEGIGGRVVVEFIVEKDGTVTYSDTIRSPHSLLEQEVMRIIEMSPEWTPAMLDGEAMPFKFLLPVDFVL